MRFYFGYYHRLGLLYFAKWVDRYPPVGVMSKENIHELTAEEFNLPLADLTAKYPYKELPELQ